MKVGYHVYGNFSPSTTIRRSCNIIATVMSKYREFIVNTLRIPTCLDILVVNTSENRVNEKSYLIISVYTCTSCSSYQFQVNDNFAYVNTTYEYLSISFISVRVLDIFSYKWIRFYSRSTIVVVHTTNWPGYREFWFKIFQPFSLWEVPLKRRISNTRVKYSDVKLRSRKKNSLRKLKCEKFLL